MDKKQIKLTKKDIYLFDNMTFRELKNELLNKANSPKRELAIRKYMKKRAIECKLRERYMVKKGYMKEQELSLDTNDIISEYCDTMSDDLNKNMLLEEDLDEDYMPIQSLNELDDISMEPKEERDINKSIMNRMDGDIIIRRDRKGMLKKRVPPYLEY